MSDTIDQLVRRFEDGKLTRRELVMALSALVLMRPEARGQTADERATDLREHDESRHAHRF